MTENIQTADLIPVKPRKKWYFRWWAIAIFFILLYLIAAFVLLATALDSQPVAQTSISSAALVDEAELYLNSQDDPFWGEKDALVKIVEFGDFQCPYCRQSFLVVREILNKYQNDIYFVYRDFPVVSIHQEALKAAEAAQCALEQEKFWPMHDKLFINQENLSLTDLKVYAMEIGLNSFEFNNCLDSGKYSAEVIQDYEDGIGLGVIGTPTFFINGYRISGSIPSEIFIKLIEQAKSEAGSL